MATNVTFHPGLCPVKCQCAITHDFARICQHRRESGPPTTEGGHNLVDWAQCQRQGLLSVTPVIILSNLTYNLSHWQSTIACALEQHLLHLRKFTYRLDGDNVRFGLNKDLGFDEKSRNENIRRIGEVRRSNPPLSHSEPYGQFFLTAAVRLLYCRSPACLRTLRVSR